MFVQIAKALKEHDHEKNRMKVRDMPLTPELLGKMNAYWRAANYLSVGQIYLYDNALLKKPLKLEHIKPRLLGHWGTTPGLNFIYVTERLSRNTSSTSSTSPGRHGGPGLVATLTWKAPTAKSTGYLTRRGSYETAVQAVLLPWRHSESRRSGDPRLDSRGATRLFALARLRGGFDNRLLVACVVGDGEAETGPLATSWHSNKFSTGPRRACCHLH